MAASMARACMLPIMCRANHRSKSNNSSSDAIDVSFIKRAAELADKSAGFTSPHPNFGCVIAAGAGNVVGEGYLYAEGTTPAEVQAVEAAGALCRDATAYLNMEPGDCHGEHTAVSALVKAGIKRVVIGMRHPSEHLRGSAIQALRSEGVQVDVLDPRLTARNGGGHMPVRVVMSQSMDLPEVAHLWNTSEVHTIVATQRGARRSFQKLLASKGVEVIEFDFLNPRDVMEYFYECGYLSILWECGGSLAASAISSGVIHKVYAFLAPKIIGGKGAPTPVGELGMMEMTQALNLHDVSFEQIGPDMLISGFLQPIHDLRPAIPSVSETTKIDPALNPYESGIISFYKTWDPYGSFSNFSPHPIRMLDENGNYVTWSAVEHYYQAHKFYGVQDPAAHECFQAIKSAKSPEEAARIGRKMQRQRPDLVRPDWETVKIDVMYRALKAKFSIYPHLNSMLVSTAGSVLVEGSPRDLFWGGGREGEGLNYLGRLLMQLRSEFLGESSASIKSPSSTA